MDPSDSRRRECCFHFDANAVDFPGSAGCVVFNTIAYCKEFIALLRKADPKIVYVDWGLNYVVKPAKV